MATNYISEITATNGTTYKLVDVDARILIDNLTVLTTAVSSTAADTPNATNIPTSATTTEAGTLTPEDATANCMYLVPNSYGSSTYNQYMAIGSTGSKKWISMGSTVVDLTGYIQVGHNSVTSTATIADYYTEETDIADVEHTHTLTETTQTIGFEMTDSATDVEMPDYTFDFEDDMVKADWGSETSSEIKYPEYAFADTDGSLTISYSTPISISKQTSLTSVESTSATKSITVSTPTALLLDDTTATGNVTIPKTFTVEDAKTGLTLKHKHKIAGSTITSTGTAVQTT